MFAGNRAVFRLTNRTDLVMSEDFASAKSRRDIEVLRKTRESHSATSYSNIPCRVLALYLGKKNSLTKINMSAGSLSIKFHLPRSLSAEAKALTVDLAQ